MRKNSHFSGQPLYGQVIKLLDKSKILQFSRENGGERYTKRFNCWIHLVVMLYAIIMRLTHCARMDETAADYRFHDNHTVLKPSIQGSRTSSKDWEKEGRNQGAYRNTCQRRCAVGYKVHLSRYK